jgi:hypothetical protein
MHIIFGTQGIRDGLSVLTKKSCGTRRQVLNDALNFRGGLSRGSRTFLRARGCPRREKLHGKLREMPVLIGFRERTVSDLIRWLAA